MDAEGEYFQYHVVDLVKDVIADGDTYHHVMDTLYQQLPVEQVDDFIKSAPAAGVTGLSGPMQELLKVTGEIKNSHVLPSDIVRIVAAEIIHRRKWEKVMKDNPHTLQALKDSVK